MTEPLDPRPVEFWVADADGTALGGPVPGYAFLTKTGDGINADFAPVEDTAIGLPTAARIPCEIQIYAGEVLIATQPIHVSTNAENAVFHLRARKPQVDRRIYL